MSAELRSEFVNTSPDGRAPGVIRMYALKRVAAFLFDYAVALAVVAAVASYADPRLFQRWPRGLPGVFDRGALFGSLFAPSLTLGVLTGLTGRTPGKLLFFLRVQDTNGDPPGLAHGVLRELMKALLVGVIYGIFYGLASVLKNRQAFYDEWLGLEVDDLRPSGLTETQKNFRKYMREKQRRERR